MKDPQSFPLPPRRNLEFCKLLKLNETCKPFADQTSSFWSILTIPFLAQGTGGTDGTKGAPGLAGSPGLPGPPGTLVTLPPGGPEEGGPDPIGLIGEVIVVLV